MESSPISEVLPSNNVDCKFVTNKLQEYSFFELEDAFFWGAMHADFDWRNLEENQWLNLKQNKEVLYSS